MNFDDAILDAKINLDPPRFREGPPICPVANLPTFSSPEGLKNWKTENGLERCFLVRIWQCEACGLWHHWSNAPSPSGDSSGTGRGHNEPMLQIAGMPK